MAVDPGRQSTLNQVTAPQVELVTSEMLEAAETTPAWFTNLPEAQQEELQMLLMTYDQMQLRPHVTAAMASTAKNSNGNTKNTSKRKHADKAKAAPAPIEPECRLKVQGMKLEVTVVLVMPHKYPEGAALQVKLRSTKAHPQVIRDLESELQQEAQEQYEMQCFGLLQLLCKTTEKVMELPASLQSEHFGCCVKCNTAAMKADKGKVLVPVSVAAKKTSNAATPDPEEQDGGESKPTVETAGVATCLLCQSIGSGVIFIPELKMAVDECCSYCLCEDNPLLQVECGCQCCLSCFQQYADIATGEDRIKQNSRTRQYGIGCPNHEGTVITNMALFKMCSPRIFLRFNSFTLKRGALALECDVCPNPTCNGFPVSTDQYTGLLFCIYCRKCTCRTCFSDSVDCECEALAPNRTVIMDYHRREVTASRVRAPSLFVPDPRGPKGGGVVVMVVAAEDKAPITLDPFSAQWLPDLIRQLPFNLRMDVEPLVFVTSETTQNVGVLATQAAQTARNKGRKAPSDAGTDDSSNGWPALAEGTSSGTLTKKQQQQQLKLAGEVSYSKGSKLPWVVFGGTVLNDSRPLVEYGIFNGCILYLVEFFKSVGSRNLDEEIELWNFRRAVANSNDTGGIASATSSAVSSKKKGGSNDPRFKKCPFCSKPVAHYRNHGCHHIGFEGSCCGRHWCYVCRHEWPCPTFDSKCGVNCNSNCDCPECPDCKPMRPCAQCNGCERCQTSQRSDFH